MLFEFYNTWILTTVFWDVTQRGPVPLKMLDKPSVSAAGCKQRAKYAVVLRSSEGGFEGALVFFYLTHENTEIFKFAIE